ncbi:MAG: alpha-aminoadipate/glutamate carrier protein LysW/ArgW [Nitrososphaerales archaeon]
MKAKCLECEGEITIPDDVVEGEIVSCPDCGADFEVVEVSSGKVELKAAEMVGEDWGE